MIDYMGFLDANSTIETDLSFQNAFETAELDFFDPVSYTHLWFRRRDPWR